MNVPMDENRLQSSSALCRRMQADERKRVSRELQTLAQVGPSHDAVDCRHLGEKLWELRISGKNAHRVFYVTLKQQRIVALHAITKKTMKTPPNDLAVARQRARDVLSRDEG